MSQKSKENLGIVVQLPGIRAGGIGGRGGRKIVLPVNISPPEMASGKAVSL